MRCSEELFQYRSLPALSFSRLPRRIGLLAFFFLLAGCCCEKGASTDPKHPRLVEFCAHNRIYLRIPNHDYAPIRCEHTFFLVLPAEDRSSVKLCDLPAKFPVVALLPPDSGLAICEVSLESMYEPEYPPAKDAELYVRLCVEIGFKRVAPAKKPPSELENGAISICIPISKDKAAVGIFPLEFGESSGD